MKISATITAICLWTINATGLVSTPPLAQEGNHQQDLEERERIVDMRYAAWLESDRYMHKLEEICDEYIALGKLDKIESLLDKSVFSNGRLAHGFRAEDIYRIHQNVALHIAQNISVEDAVIYLKNDTIKEIAHEDFAETIADNIGNIATRLAGQGDLRSLKMLEQIPWSTHPIPVKMKGTKTDYLRWHYLERAVGLLASNGKLDEATKVAAAFSEQESRDMLLASIFSDAAGIASHAELVAVFERIENLQWKEIAVASGFISASHGRIPKDKADVYLTFCEEFGKQAPSRCLELANDLCSGYFEPADRQRALRIATEMFAEIPEDQRDERDKELLCKCHIYTDEFLRGLELFFHLELESDFLIRSYTSLLSNGDVCKKIINQCTPNQIAEIVDAIPDQHVDKPEVLAHMLRRVSEIRDSKKRDAVVDKFLAIRQTQPKRARLNELDFTLSMALGGMLENRENTAQVVKLVRYIDRELKGIQTLHFWARIAIAAWQHGQKEEYESSLEQIAPENRLQVQLQAVFGSGDREEVLRQLDTFLSEKTNTTQSLDDRIQIVKDILSGSFLFSTTDLDVNLAIWREVYDKLTPQENRHMIGFAIVRVRNSPVANPMACLAYLEDLETLTGPDPEIQIARCNANLWARQFETAREIFAELVETEADLEGTDCMVFLKQFAAAGIFEPHELCVEKSVKEAIEPALKHLLHRYVKQGDHSSAIQLAEKITSPDLKSDFLEELTRVLKQQTERSEQRKKE